MKLGAQDVTAYLGDKLVSAQYLGATPIAGGGGGPFRVTDSILGAGGLEYSMFDSSPISYDRMWQEDTGQTPAALASPVGLLLDRSKQAAKTFAQVMAGQPELVVNGNFATDLNGWTVTAVGTGSVVWQAGVARCQGADGSANQGRIAQAESTTIGKLYVLTVDVGVNSGMGAILVGNSIGNGAIYAASVGAGRQNVIFIASATSTWIGFRNAGTGGDCTFDNVSVKEVPAHYASQASAGARPVLQSDGLKFDGSDDNLLTDWFAQAGANCLISQISVPAVVSATQIICGVGATSGRFQIGIRTDGTLHLGVGNVSTSAGGPDLRGQTAVVGISVDGTTVRAFVNDQMVYEQPQNGTPLTSLPLRLGALNNDAGVAAGFFGGSSKRTPIGKTALTLSQFLQIRAELLAAA